MPDEQPTSVSDVVEQNAKKPVRTFEDYRNSFWFWVLDRYGLPMLLLFVIGWAGLKFAGWMQPKADQLIQKHIEIVDTAKSLGQESLEVQRDMKVLMDKVVNDGVNLDRTSTEHMRMTSDIRDDVRDIHRVVVPDIIARPRSTGTTLNPQ